MFFIILIQTEVQVWASIRNWSHFFFVFHTPLSKISWYIILWISFLHFYANDFKKKWSIVICYLRLQLFFSLLRTNFCNKMRSIFVIALLLFVTTTFAQDDAAAAAPAEERAHDIEPRILNLRILISFSWKWVFSFWKSWKLSFFIKINHYYGFLKF